MRRFMLVLLVVVVLPGCLFPGQKPIPESILMKPWLVPAAGDKALSQAQGNAGEVVSVTE